MSKIFNCDGATILVVKDVSCELYGSNLESVAVKKYSLGKIVKEESDEYCIVNLYNNTQVKLHKKYIVINLCDVMQKEVIYSIVNANKAIYHIHESSIPGVTDKKLYPNMKICKKLFVPLMFNTSKKLFHAEEEFLKKNLTIKIYDAYRPYSITKYLYKILLKLVDNYYDYLNGSVNGHSYNQTDFLASKTSTHNYGIALDMTLVDLETNKELEMQTKMHDLSIYSVTDYNNENADMLAKIMSKNGFFPLESEWWHFQDDNSKVDYMDFYIDDDGNIKEFSNKFLSFLVEDK